MIISTFKYPLQDNAHFEKKIIKNNINSQKHNCAESLYLMSNYNKPCVSFCSAHGIDSEKLKSLNITNLHVIDNDCVRGESLSSKKNRKFLIPIKRTGIETVIDLRDKYTSTVYEDLCKQHGLQYLHIPIDSSSVEDKEIIKNFKTLFQALNKGKVYMACAQGLHRTDIALALNYIYNPREQEVPPVMYGHFREYGFKYDDILRRVNSINKKITPEDLEALGWNKENCADEINSRKRKLLEYNMDYIKEQN